MSYAMRIMKKSSRAPSSVYLVEAHKFLSNFLLVCLTIYWRIVQECIFNVYHICLQFQKHIMKQRWANRLNTNTKNIRQKISTEYEYEYYSTKNFHRIRIRILFGLKISPNTNTNSRLFECIRIYSNIFKYILSQMDIYAKF